MVNERHITDLTEQQVLNYGLDKSNVNPPTSIRGMLEYADGGGWVRVPVSGKYPVTQYDWTSGELDYIGINTRIAAADGDTDWVIIKITWVSGNPTTIKQRVTSWLNRSAGW